MHDVNLTINPGETIAVVGASGAGKTTVAALLARLRVPDAGQVLVDGYPVSQLSDSERIARIATVSQDVHVFSACSANGGSPQGKGFATRQGAQRAGLVTKGLSCDQLVVLWSPSAEDWVTCRQSRGWT